MNENSVTLRGVEHSNEQNWLNNSIVSGLANLLSPQQTAGLVSIVAIGSILGFHTSGIYPTKPSYALPRVSQRSALTYTEDRGVAPMTRRHAISHAKGHARTVSRMSRFETSITEDTTRVVHSGRVVTQAKGKARTVEHKSRWSAE